MDPVDIRTMIEHHAAALPGLPPAAEAGAGSGLPRGRRLRIVNPTCGDVADLTLTTAGGVVQLRGLASGCSLSRAAASMLAEALGGRAPAAALHLARDLVEGRSAGSAVAVDADVAVLTDLPVAPLRRRCILLSWTATVQLLEALVEPPPGPQSADRELHSPEGPPRM